MSVATLPRGCVEQRSDTRMRLAMGAVFLLALGLRVGIVTRSAGGPLGDFGYDSSVYYSAADALIHGRMPYADFTLLHPPAVMLVVTPFALLGSFTSDHLGFVVANCAFEGLGAFNAVLVVLIGRSAGVGRRAALVGGVAYACWTGAAGAEISIRLEPLGNFFLLCALLLLVRDTRRQAASTRSVVLAGAFLGAAAVTKIWWAVPLLIVLGWTARRGRRYGALVGLGALASIGGIAGPFFLRSPSSMWRMVVVDQLGRPHVDGTPVTRLGRITSLDLLTTVNGTTTLLLLPVGALALAVALRAWRCEVLRLVVVLAGAQLLVLLFAPTYFVFYADYLTPAGALVIAAASAATRDRDAVMQRRALTTVVLATIAASAVVDLVVKAPSTVAPFPGRQLAADAERARVRCIMSDSPMALIELDVLSSDLSHGCPDRVDVSGSTYDLDRPPDGAHVLRTKNARWQHDLYRYLTSGGAELTIRKATGISHATARRLDRLPAIAKSDGLTIRRTG